MQYVIAGQYSTYSISPAILLVEMVLSGKVIQSQLDGGLQLSIVQNHK